MFNLIMSADEEQWERSPTTVGRLRMFEYTSSELKSRFSSLAGDALKELLDLPCLFAYEKDIDKPARIGRALRLQQRRGDDRLDLHFEIDGSFPPIDSSRIVELSWELDIGGWELNRTHWAVKDVDLFSVLSDAGVISAESAMSVAIEEVDGARSTISPDVA